jgi:hypothetical protein
MHVHNDRIYLFPLNIKVLPKYDWVVLDTLGNTIFEKQFNCYHKIGYPPPFDLLIFNNERKLYRYRSISDTIFEIYEDGYNVAYLLERKYSDGYRMYSKEEIGSTRNIEFLSRSLDNVKLRIPESFHGIGDKWIVEFRTKFRKNVDYETAIFDLEQNNMTLVNRTRKDKHGRLNWGIPIKWLGFGTLKPNDVVIINSEYYVVSSWNIMDLKELVKTDAFVNGSSQRPFVRNRLKSLADSLDLEADPILFMLKIKHSQE